MHGVSRRSGPEKARRLASRLALSLLIVCGIVSIVPVEQAGSTRQSASAYTLFVQPGAHLAPVLSLIRAARHTLRLEVYLLTDRTVIKELGKARQRGVSVRVLLEEHPYGGDRSARSAFDALRQAGVPVQWANERAFTYTHEKAMDVDDRVAGIFTFNLTSSGIFRNREFGVVDQNADDARALGSIFDADWNRRGAGVSSSRLVISPYNARATIQRLVDGARRTLDLYAEEINDPSIESHLANAVHRKVRVRLITSSQSAGVDTLRRDGVDVTLLVHPYIHAKAIVADGVGLFIGSENISTTSLDHNREAGIMLSDSGLASIVEHTFAADWGGFGTPSPPPPAPRSGKLSVHVSLSAQSVRRGQSLTIEASTTPGSSCSVKVTYPDGYVSRSRVLAERRTADSSGAVSWTWRVGSTKSGVSQVGVTCTLGRLSASGSATFQIQ